MPPAFSENLVDHRTEQTGEFELSCLNLSLRRKLGFATCDTSPEIHRCRSINKSVAKGFLDFPTVVHGPVNFVSFPGY